MKNKILTGICFMLIALGGIITVRSAETNQLPSSSGNITITSTQDLYQLALRWTSEYNKVNSQAKITVTSVSDITDGLGLNDLNIISEEKYKGLQSKPEFQMIVGHDAIVPIISTKNPLIYNLNEKGVSKENLSKALVDPSAKNWNTLIGSGQNLPLNVYLPYNSHVKEIVANYLGLATDKMNYIMVQNEKDLVATVQNDPNGIGFSRMISVFDETNQGLPGNIILLPIDKNSNGKLDYFERIYENWSDFLRGVWIGKYPHELCQNIYVMASALPQDKTQLDFLKWVLTSGQPYLGEFGYFDLVNSDRQQELEKLTPVTALATPSESYSNVKAVLFFMVGLIIVGVALSFLVSYYRNKRKTENEIKLVSSSVLDSESVKVMPGVYFDRSHTWSFMEKDGFVRVGIDDFLQHVTGPITCVKMKKQGEKVSKGEIFLSVIQDGKRLNIKSPVTGTIKEHNDVLIMNSTLLNTSPFNEGWIYMIEPSNWFRELQSLIMADRYHRWIKDELIRLKDFLSVSLKEHRLEFAAVTLQDGGELNDNVLEGFGPEVWDDFQTNFLDKTI